jgi:hypothetical protein
MNVGGERVDLLFSAGFLAHYLNFLFDFRRFSEGRGALSRKILIANQMSSFVMWRISYSGRAGYSPHDSDIVLALSYALRRGSQVL